MNEYDSKRMAELLETTHGLKLVSSPDKADVLLMNTCSIREKAQEKVFSQLGRWRPFKEARPEVVIGVGGCVASQEGEAIRQRAPFVDIVFGPQTLHRLPTLLNTVKREGKPAIDISFPEIEKFDHLPEPKAEGPTAGVSIQEGCTKYCTFCVVPYTRGEEVNRPFEDVLGEIYLLANQGVKEITLLGQNVNAYQAQLPDGHTADLGLLIRFVAEIAGIERIRFITSHPREFSPSLIAAFRDVPKLVNHLHLPIQSGSDRILSLMGRGHTALEYKSKIRRLKAVRPTLFLSSDFIVGYPGETEEDFEATLNLVKEVHFDQSYSFIYSPRPGTPAALLADNVTAATKQQRLQKLQEQLNQQAKALSESMVGTTQQVLVTNPSKKDPTMLYGRADNQRLIHFQGPSMLVGKLVNVHITHAFTNSLRGRLQEVVSYA